ncbi:MAG: SIS domain-containing protein [Candidatus Asgardarchaeia archaeon]
MNIKAKAKEFIEKVKNNILDIDDSQLEQVINLIQSCNRIFTIGQGRSALVAQNSAIRLLQVGFNVSVVGEDVLNIAPPIGGAGDLVIAISGSGETTDVITYCNAAKKKGAKVLAITSFDNSQLAKLADSLLIVKGRTSKWHYKSFVERELYGEREQISIEGSLFEVSVLVLFEAIASILHEIMAGEKKS